jgi:hypothetical protein
MPGRCLEFLEALRVEDERDGPPGIADSRPGVAERARAQAVHEIDAVFANQPGSGAPRAETEPWVRGDAIEHGRAAAAGERERAVGHRDNGAAGEAAGFRPGRGRRPGDEGHRDAALHEVADEIVHVAFEAAVAVQGVDRA